VLLESRLNDPNPGVALYAFNKLNTLEERVIVKALPELIRHPVPEVRREAFSRIETLGLRTALDAVMRQLSIETVPGVTEHALRALGAIADEQAYSLLTHKLNITEFHTRRGALVGLLKYHESQVAEQMLDYLLRSSSSKDRSLAAQVLGEAGRTRFVEAHRALLHDPDLTVRREAIRSVAKSRQTMLYPVLIDACDFPETSRAAARALIDIGQEVFPQIKTAFLQLMAPRQRLLVLPKVMARIGGSHARTPVHSKIYSADAELRTQILNALSECSYRTKDRSEIYLAIKLEIEPMVWVCAAQTDLGDSERMALLSGALNQFCIQTRDRVLLLLAFAFDAYSILRVRDTLLTGSSSHLPYALEILDTQVPAEWKPMILPLFENLSAQERLQRLAILFPQAHESSEQRLWSLIASMQFTKWIRVCAIHAAGELCASACYELIQNASGKSDPLIRETARWALAQFSTDGQAGRTSMLSTIEKVLILKTVDMFNQTPDNVLADVADLLEEMEVSENETIFNKGEQGDSMYIIVDGKVRVHTEERLLNYLGESDVFGEMALLDPEPRLASVTAVEATHLFRLDQAPFYELMAERPEVATGIIRVLTGHLRNRVQDIAQLQARITELETGKPA
jgi:HEAT repeat protein